MFVQGAAKLPQCLMFVVSLAAVVSPLTQQNPRTEGT
jgi:hypothetical protein